MSSPYCVDFCVYFRVFPYIFRLSAKTINTTFKEKGAHMESSLLKATSYENTVFKGKSGKIRECVTGRLFFAKKGILHFISYNNYGRMKKGGYSMAFPREFLDELINRSDIVDVVSSYVSLTKKGGNYFGLCPFHNEKTPSFTVNEAKGFYQCFGCRYHCTKTVAMV